MITKLKRAALMCRVSSDEQVKGYSLDIQDEALRKYCARYGIEIVYSFREDHSAKDFKRPEFTKFLSFLSKNKGKVDCLLFTSWDRFSRNVTDSLIMLRRLESYGITSQAIEQPIDMTIPENKAMLAIFLTLPEIDNDRRSIKIRGGVRAALKAGRWSRVAPIGYINSRDSENKPLIKPSMSTAPLVKMAFEYVLNGTPQVEIISTLRKKGLNTNKSTLSSLLRNPIYMGKIAVPAEGEELFTLVNGVHEAIVSEDLYYKVQDLLKSKQRNLNKAFFTTKREELPLRGNLLCARCGEHVTGSASKSKTGKRHFYYHCNHCHSIRVPSEKANTQVKDILKLLKFEGSFDELYTALCGKRLKNLKPIEKNQSVKKERIDELKFRLINTQDMLADNKISYEIYIEMRNRYASELEQLETETKELDTISKETKERIKQCHSILTNLDNLYDKANLEGKQKIVSSIFPEKIIFGEKKSRTPRLNQAILLSLNIGKASTKRKTEQLSEIFELSGLVELEGIEPSSKQGINKPSTYLVNFYFSSKSRQTHAPTYCLSSLSRPYTKACMSQLHICDAATETL